MLELPIPPPLPDAAAPLYVDECRTIRVGDSRLTLDVFLGAYLRGIPPEEIIEMYDTISLSQAYAAIGYYLAHREILDAYLKEREIYAEALTKKIDERQGPGLSRSDLQARRAEKIAS